MGLKPKIEKDDSHVKDAHKYMGGGIAFEDLVFIRADELETWEKENKTEDADFEIIEPKQLSNGS